MALERNRRRVVGCHLSGRSWAALVATASILVAGAVTLPIPAWGATSPAPKHVAAAVRRASGPRQEAQISRGAQASAPGWSQEPAQTNGPPARFGEGLAFDGNSNQMLMFGGEGLASSAGASSQDCGPPPNNPTGPSVSGQILNVVNQLESDALTSDGSQPLSLQDLDAGMQSLWSAAATSVDSAIEASLPTYGPLVDYLNTAGLCEPDAPAAADVAPLGDTWTWNGQAWSQMTGIAEPPARAFPAMAYDSASHQLVLFGGSDGNALGDTWIWNGTGWSEATPADSPPARLGAAMAYDPDLGQLVLYGGMGANGVDLADTWTWNGTDWTQVDTPPTNDGAGAAPGVPISVNGEWFDLLADAIDDSAGGGFAPPPMVFPSLAFDQATDQMVLWSGTKVPGPEDLIDTACASNIDTCVLPPGQIDFSAFTSGSTTPNDGEMLSWTFSGTQWNLQTPSPSTSCNVSGYTFTGIVCWGAGIPGIIGSTSSSAFTTPPTGDGSTMAYDPATGTLWGYSAAYAGDGFPDGSISPNPVGYPCPSTVTCGNQGYLATWDSTDPWQVQAGGLGDPNLADPQMAFDPATGQMVVFGGYDGVIGTDLEPSAATYVMNPASTTASFAAVPSQPDGHDFSVAPYLSSSSSAPFSVTSKTPAVCSATGELVSPLAAGTCTLKASQAASGESSAGSVTGSVTIGPAPLTVAAPVEVGEVGTSEPSLIPVEVGVVNGDEGSAVGTFSCTSTAPVSGGNLTEAGSWPVTCSGTASANYAPTFTAGSLTVIAPSNQYVYFQPLAGHTYGDAPFDIAVGNTAPEIATLTSVTPGVCTVGAGTLDASDDITTAQVSLVGAGTCSLQASAPEIGIYPAATPVTGSFPVAEQSQSIQESPVPTQTLGSAAWDLSQNALATSGLPVAFISGTPSVCSVSGTLVTGLSAGTCTVTATQPGSADVAAAPTQSLSFAEISLGQSISDFLPVPDQSVGATPVTMDPLATSGLPVTVATSTPSVCTVAPVTGGWSVSSVATGSCTLAATQPGDLTYQSVTVSESFTVAAQSQDIQTEFGGWNSTGQPIVDPVTNGVANELLDVGYYYSASSGLPLDLVSNTPEVCTVNGDQQAVPVTNGQCQITISQPGNATYAPAAPVVLDFLIEGDAQSLYPEPISAEPYGAQFDASGAFLDNDDLPVSVSTTTPTVCSVVGTTVSMLATGTCTLLGLQLGSSEWQPASATDSFTVTKSTQKVSFTNVNPNGGPPQVNGGPFLLTAASTAGLPVTLTTAGACTGMGTGSVLVQATGPGSCTVKASQAGNGDYKSASSVTHKFTWYVGTGSDAWVTSSVPSPVAGQSTTLTAVIESPGVPASSLNGTAEFAAGEESLSPPVVLGTATVTDGVATLKTTALPVDSALDIDVAPDVANATGLVPGQYLPTLNFDVGRAASATSLVLAPTAPTYGQVTKLTASVLRHKPASGTVNSGTVTFTDNGTTLGSTPVHKGAATLSTTALPLGTSAVTASFSGDTDDNASTSPASVVVVGTAPTVTTLSVSNTAPTYGQNPGVTASVKRTTGGAEPAGTVTFSDGITPVATVALSKGKATFPWKSALTVSTHVLRATFNATATDQASTSAKTSFNVAPAQASLDLTANPTSPSAGQTVTFTATVTGAVAPANAPTGIVSVQDGLDVISAPLVDGAATFTVSGLATGSDEVFLLYSGDDNYKQGHTFIVVNVSS